MKRLLSGQSALYIITTFVLVADVFIWIANSRLEVTP